MAHSTRGICYRVLLLVAGSQLTKVEKLISNFRDALHVSVHVVRSQRPYANMLASSEHPVVMLFCSVAHTVHSEHERSGHDAAQRAGGGT